VAHVDGEEHVEETITFEATADSEGGNVPVPSSTTPLFDTDTPAQEEPDVHASESTSSGSNEGTDYEMVGATDGDTDTAELDELEAEIARELED
jgi:hypothetical protein